MSGAELIYVRLFFSGIYLEKVLNRAVETIFTGEEGDRSAVEEQSGCYRAKGVMESLSV